MELAFEKQELSCLRKVTGETVSGEQTQELRLPEGMPDVANVVATWGQVLLRGKEWRTGGMTVSGGVMAWVLYGAEDGSYHCTDVWLPFQMKWDFPDPGRDGRICVWGLLQGMDARCLSARKIMVRANVSLCGSAYVKDTVELPQAQELPEDVQLQMATYPLCLLKEAGEHSFSLEESLSVPEMDQCIYYAVTPMITEERLMGDKLVFRGNAGVHMLYKKDGSINCWDGEIPFSQFCDLEGSFGQDATANLIPAITAMEIETGENGCLFKCGITCQYQICDRHLVRIPEDGYSTQREWKLQQQEIEVPCILQQRCHSLPIGCRVPWEGTQMIDGRIYPGNGVYDPSEKSYILPMWGHFVFLDPEGKVKNENYRWEEKLAMEADTGVRPIIYPQVGSCHFGTAPDSLELRGEMELQELTAHNCPMSGLAGMELGAPVKKDPHRPSLILRRLGQEALWDVAKSCCTTVSAIREANNLTDDCSPNKMLIIPIN